MRLISNKTNFLPKIWGLNAVVGILVFLGLKLLAAYAFWQAILLTVLIVSLTALLLKIVFSRDPDLLSERSVSAATLPIPVPSKESIPVSNADITSTKLTQLVNEPQAHGVPNTTQIITPALPNPSQGEFDGSPKNKEEIFSLGNEMDSWHQGRSELSRLVEDARSRVLKMEITSIEYPYKLTRQTKRNCRKKTQELVDRANLENWIALRPELLKICITLNKAKMAWVKDLGAIATCLFAALDAKTIGPEENSDFGDEEKSILGALAYLAEPFDIIPDHIFGEGYSDDAFVLNECLLRLRKTNPGIGILSATGLE